MTETHLNCTWKSPSCLTGCFHTKVGGKFKLFRKMANFEIHTGRTNTHCMPNAKRLMLCGRLYLKCDGTHGETKFCLSAKRMSPFKSAGASVQSTSGSRGVRISSSNAGYTMFRGSVKSTGYPLHSPISPSLPLLCVTVCCHISTGLYT